MSTMRHCEIFKAENGKWYLELGDYEHAGPENSTTYGPFPTMEKADDYIRNFSNPGGLFIDDSGEREAPTESGDGSPVQRPSSSQGCGFPASRSRYGFRLF